MKISLTIIVVLTFILAYFSVGSTPSTIQAEGKPYHHLASGHFRNAEGNPSKNASRRDMWQFFWKSFIDAPSTETIPRAHIVDKERALVQLKETEGFDSVTWLGHASFLLQLDGISILTDPFLSERAGKGFVGPKRFIPPGIAIDDLPPIDIILIGHNHYDHLDITTLKALPNKENIHVFVPLMLGNFVKSLGYEHVVEVDWYDEFEVNSISITALPSVHWSRRGLFDTNKTLWASYAIKSAEQTVFFASDTGYGPVFQQIGEHYGGFDVALIPIGAYEPRVIMQPSHTNPEEAVQLALDIKANTIVGMHWGSIVLTHEPVWEPPIRFLAAADDRGISSDNAWVMAIGETRVLQ